MQKESTQMMVVTPHPDDAEFGVAGTVVKWTREGKDVVYVVCTNGDKGTSDVNMVPEELAKTREQEQLAAAKLLGVREVVFLRYPDQSLEDTPDFRKEVVRQIRLYRPDTVVTADPNRRYLWHRDHRITGRVIMDAVFPYSRDYLAYPDLLKAELQPHCYLSSTSYALFPRPPRIPSLKSEGHRSADTTARTFLVRKLPIAPVSSRF